VWPAEGPNPFIEAAHETLGAIEQLDPAIVVPGHGVPFDDVAAAVANVRAKLDAFGRDPAKNARHMVKVMFVFALLDRGAMAVEEVAPYVARVPCYREVSERFLGLAPAALAEWMLGDLRRAGAVRVEGSKVLPTMAA
jgi:hypothetical protein